MITFDEIKDLPLDEFFEKLQTLRIELLPDNILNEMRDTGMKTFYVGGKTYTFEELMKEIRDIKLSRLGL